MIFVTAQPDVPYFHWQIMVYIHNFIEQGILPNQIHILLGIISEDGKPTKESLKLKDTGVNVHHYIDDRHQKHYIPTVKPFLISKWLKDFPEHGECFFLHDSDIIFRKLPNFDSLINDNITYLSDTIGYIGYNYIMDCCNRYENTHPTSGKGQLLNEMANVIGVSVECIECNQENSGGGQYIIKNTDWLLWKKIYDDCVPLYDQMLDYQKRFPISPGEIQFWTAEMWSLLWNLWLHGIETRITPELDFSWATDSIKIYEDKPILHMAGVTDNQKKDKFYKGDFINSNPLDKLKEDINFFNYVSSQSSTKKYVEVMESLVKKQIKDYL
jgi:hypothetical protein